MSSGPIQSPPADGTTAAITLFLSPSGLDSNPGTTAMQPLLTLAGARAKLPKRIRHPIIINLAAGSYPGDVFTGFTFDPADAALGAYIQVLGTLADATLGSGTPTGTSTSAALGSNPTFGTMTDSTQTWAVDALKGKLVEVTSGTGVGQIRVIRSNTATQLTIAGSWATAPTASGYAIRDCASVLNTATNAPALPGLTSAASAGLLIGSNVGAFTSAATAHLVFERVKIAPATGTAARIRGNASVAFLRCQIQSATASAQGLNADSGCQLVLEACHLASGTSLAGVLGTQGTGAPVSGAIRNSLVESGLTAGNLLGLSVASFIISGTEIRATAATGTAVAVGTSNISGIQFIGNMITGNGVGIGLRLLPSSSNGSPVVFGWNAVLLSGFATGIDVSRGAFLAMGGSGTVLTGPGSGTGILVAVGGRVEIPTSLTMSGWTNDVSVDGTLSTIAALQALVPPTIFNLNYGSWIGR